MEDITSERLAEVVASGCYLPTADVSDLAGFDVALITVPTPLREGEPDLSVIQEAGRSVSSHLSAGAVVVLENRRHIRARPKSFWRAC